MQRSFMSTPPVLSTRYLWSRRGGIAGLTMTLLLLVAGVLWLAQDFLVQEASKNEMEIARVVVHEVDRTFRTSRFMLAGMALHVKAADGTHAGAGAALDAMAERLSYEPALAAVSVNDSQGAAIASGPNEPSMSGLHAADIVAVAVDKLYGIGTPRHDAVSGRWVWPIVRRIDLPGHAAPAYAAVWIDIDRLHAQIAAAVDLDNRSLLVVRHDGIGLFRIPWLDFESADYNLSVHSVFSRIASGVPYGTFIGRSPIDGVRRVAGFAQATESGLIAVNSRREGEVLWSQLTNGTVVAVMLGAGLIFFMAIGLGVLLWQMRARTVASERESILGLLELADASIAIADPKSQNLVYVNPAFERMNGYSAAEAIGRNCRFLQGPATDSATVAHIRECIAEGRPVRADILNYRKDGTPFWSDLHIVPIRGPDGALTAFVGACFDITKRVHMADALRAALERARAADQAKSTFLARMSHELRTPLNAIIGFSETILLRMMGPLPDRYAEYAGDIHNSGRHLLSLVERILEMARLEADGRVIEARPVSLAEIVRGAATLSQSAIDDAGARLQFELDGPAMAQGDPTALRQIAVNLISNAARHGKKGGIIRVRAFLVDGARAQLEVIDDGPGLSPELLEQIGTPFLNRRADTSDGQGVGLGIAISTELARRMGGSLAIVNATPGARATLDLPAAARDAARPVEFSATPRAPSVSMSSSDEWTRLPNG